MKKKKKKKKGSEIRQKGWNLERERRNSGMLEGNMGETQRNREKKKSAKVMSQAAIQFHTDCTYNNLEKVIKSMLKLISVKN